MKDYLNLHPLAYLAQALAPLALPPAQHQAECHQLLVAAFGEGILPQLWAYNSASHWHQPQFAKAWQQLSQWVNQRLTTLAPLQYVLGQAGFYGRLFAVNPAVLIPRPETELLVEQALTLLKAYTPLATSPLTVWEVGTGSGCIALTLVLEAQALGLPLRLVASDCCPKALTVAQHNAKRLLPLGVSPITWLLGETYAPYEALPLTGKPQLIISNPPYIAEALAPTLTPEVLCHEPHRALFAQNEGFGVIAPLISQAPKHLAPHGHLLLEVGQGMTPQTQALLHQAGFQHTWVVNDFAGHDRVVIGQWP
jgi:release factor glutamine methyltransferase